MFTYSSLNAFGCLRSASASVLPDSTSNTTCRVTSLSAGFSLCVARMSSACTSGRPALIIVENWRVKMTMSRILIDPPRFFFVRGAFVDLDDVQLQLPELLDDVVARSALRSSPI